MACMTTFALLMGVLLAWGLTRSITGPISRAVALARAVAAGDFSSSAEVGGVDETGQLLATLKAMNDNLARVVGQVRQTCECIAADMARLTDGNGDLGQRTEAQASSLHQTAASMEVSTALNQLAQVTQRNAALVEESRATADRLRVQVAHLSTLVGMFKLTKVTR